jgi:hypothetical protein
VGDRSVGGDPTTVLDPVGAADTAAQPPTVRELIQALVVIEDNLRDHYQAADPVRPDLRARERRIIAELRRRRSGLRRLA